MDTHESVCLCVYVNIYTHICVCVCVFVLEDVWIDVCVCLCVFHQHPLSPCLCPSHGLLSLCLSFSTTPSSSTLYRLHKSAKLFVLVHSPSLSLCLSLALSLSLYLRLPGPT